MNKGESKTPLVLMEQVIMVLVFALAAALCVQAFVYARAVSLSILDRDNAMHISQSLAENGKAFRGDMERLKTKFGGEIGTGQLALFYDSDWERVPDEKGAAYEVVFAPEERQGACGFAVITTRRIKDREEIFSIKIAWQEALNE